MIETLRAACAEHVMKIEDVLRKMPISMIELRILETELASDIEDSEDNHVFRLITRFSWKHKA